MKTGRVLVVDDREENVYLLRALLEGNGYQVVASANGAEALEAARGELPDLIITDILMPVMDGFALCREWKRDADLRSIPFIFYTATYTDERDREFALSLGAERFVVKPQEPEALLAVIRETMEHVGRPPAAPAPAAGAGGQADAAEQDERVYLKHYNEALVRKLEGKMEQLERANRELERDVAARRLAEAEVRRLNETLEQRVIKRTAQLKALNGELESFSYSVSHDLRAPLRAIDGYVNILLEDYAPQLDEEGRRISAAISQGARRMGRLVDDLLAFSRVGRSEMQSALVDMEALVTSAFHELTAREDRGRIGFRVGALPTVTGDPVLLREVWMNLLGNAVKFSSRRERAEIDVASEATDGEVTFSVRDNGAGFDPKYQAKLFEAFQRLHGATEFEGTGIGLAIVERIVRRHGGRVWAEGAPDQGATFFFSLPAAD